MDLDSSNEKIDSILIYVKKIDNDLAVIKQKTDRIEPIESNVKELRAEVDYLKSELENLKKAERANNLIIYKIPDDTNFNVNLKNSVLKIIQQINPSILDTDILSTFRLGKNVGKRPVLVRFTSKQLKSSIFRYLDKIKSLGYAVGDDLTPIERTTRKNLLKFFPTLREKGFKPKIKSDKILLGKDMYDVDGINAMLAIDPLKTSTSGLNEDMSEHLATDVGVMPHYEGTNAIRTTPLQPTKLTPPNISSPRSRYQKRKAEGMGKDKDVKITKFLNQSVLEEVIPKENDSTPTT